MIARRKFIKQAGAFGLFLPTYEILRPFAHAQQVVRRPLANPAGGGAVTFDAVGGDSNDTNTVTFNHVTGAGSNRIILFGIVSWVSGGGQSVSSLTYNGSGTGVTSVGNQTFSGGDRLDIYRLLNPALGTNAVVVTLTTGSSIAVGSISFSGVHQTTPLGTPAFAQAASTAPTVDVGSATGEVVLGVMGYFGDNITDGGGQTRRFNVPGTTARDSSMGWTEAGATTVTISATIVGGDAFWVIGGVSIKPA